MTVTALLADLLQQGLALWVKDGELYFRASKGTLTPALREQLVEHKQNIIGLLAENKRYLFPSFAQQRMWFLDQLDPNSSFYNVPAALSLSGTLSVAAMRQSLNEIVRRHEALRTTFVALDGRPVQVVTSDLVLPLPVIDLQKLAGAEQEVHLRQLVIQEAQRPFDLLQGPLLRTSLLRLDAEAHVLLLNMHHIVSDGWSLGVFVRELAALYEAFSAGKSSPLPELPIQYADFASWQWEWLQGEVLERQLAYWAEQLVGDLPVLELPADRPRPAVETHRGARLPFVWPEPLSEALKALSWQQGSTLFMTLLAAFKTLLYRYTGQTDIIVGTPIANRNRTEIEDLIGFFVNTLVLRTDLSGNPTFLELLDRVHKMTLDTFDHQDLPFEKLVEELQPERDLSRSPLFQVLFVLQNAPAPALELSNLTLSSLEIDRKTARFDLTLFMWEEDQNLAGTLEYNTDLFDADTMTRLVGHLQTLLQGIVADPRRRLSDLPILSEAERLQLLVEWNGTAVEYPRDLCVHQLFEAQVQRTPDAVAVAFPSTSSGRSPSASSELGPLSSDGDQQLTYRELNQRANQVAHYMRALGVGPEVLVGLYMERSPETVVGLLGVLKAGGTYVPLDPAYPQERLTFMLRDSQAALLLTQRHLLNQLSAPPVRVICLETDGQHIARMPTTNPPCFARAGNLAYTIYTSGSTGKPKGVQILHCAVANFLDSMSQRPGLAQRDVLLSVTTLSFDIAVLELFLPLTLGARIELVSRAVAADGARLKQRLVESRATAMQATPASWRLLLEVGWRNEQGLKILCGGEALSRELADRLLELEQGTLWNLYGPTETTVWSATCQVGAGGEVLPIGRPISNTRFYLLDAHLQPVPVGVPGELYIGGSGLARGYLNRPDLTAEKFVPDPFLPPSFPPPGGDEGGGVRLYKTGDLARYLPNGDVEFLGRIDHQVKIRGFRIELGEIEAQLGQYPGLKQTVVIARDVEREAGEKQLVAYFVPQAGWKPTVSEMRRFLHNKLPDYMIPSAFVTLEAFPLTPSGKIDRRTLPVPDGARPQLEGVYIAPRTPVEEVLVEIWAGILGIERIGIHDNFFELGGHSLLATQVLSRMRDALQVELPLRSFFEAPTVARLAQTADHHLQAEPSAAQKISLRDFEEGKL